MVIMMLANVCSDYYIDCAVTIEAFDKNKRWRKKESQMVIHMMKRRQFPSHHNRTFIFAESFILIFHFIYEYQWTHIIFSAIENVMLEKWLLSCFSFLIYCTNMYVTRWPVVVMLVWVNDNCQSLSVFMWTK